MINLFTEIALGQKLKLHFKNVKFIFDNDSKLWITNNDRLINQTYERVNNLKSNLKKSLKEPNLIIHMDYNICGFGLD